MAQIDRDRLEGDKLKFYDIISKAEAVYTQSQTEEEDARKYYEGSQAPEIVPNEITYVEHNKITDMVNGLVGQLLGADIDIQMRGGGEASIPYIELVYDMFERNKFNDRVKEPWGNFFYVEGIAPIEFYYNPRRKSQYGMGFPELIVRRPDQALTDPNSEGFMHEDDIHRVLRYRKTVAWAVGQWPDKKDEIFETSDLTGGNQTEGHCDLYIVESVRTVITEEDGIKTEKEVYYKAKVINKIVVVEPEKETGFNRFTHQFAIHTARFITSKRPCGAVKFIKATQDEINADRTAAYMALKADIKNLFVSYGATDDEADTAMAQIAKTNGYINFRDTATKFEQIKKQGLSPAILQSIELAQRAFDEISGRYAPERGVVDQNISGRAIGMLHNRGKIPELTKKLHIQYVIGEIVMLFLECAQKKMTEEFYIERKKDGQKVKMYYNTKAEDIEGFRPDQYNVVDDDGIVNNLLKIDIDQVDLSIDIKMNALEEEAYESEKALMAYQNQLLPPRVTLKKLYPREGEEYYKELTEYNQVMGFVQKVVEQGGTQILPILQQGANAIIQSQQMQQEAGKLTKGVNNA